MRVLFIANCNQLYGANHSMLTIIEYLYNSEYDVKLILPFEGDICRELDMTGMGCKVMPIFTQLYYLKRNIKYLAPPILDIWTFFKLPFLTKEVKKLSPDVIYSNASVEMTGIEVVKELGVKRISHIREFMNSDCGAQFIIGKEDKGRLINQSDGVIYVSYSVVSHVNLGEPLGKSQKVIYNGLKDANVESEGKEIYNSFNLGTVGIFNKAEGQDLAINAMPKILEIFPNAKLNIWGDKEGGFRRVMHKLVKSLNLSSSVIFHGFERNPN